MIYCSSRFWSFLLADQITVIGNEISVKHRDLQVFISNYANISNFRPLEIVSRYRGAQLRVVVSY